ncbi:MAG: hypothetical protein ACK4PI_13615 [Tepidisphaerales bacterium]
MRRSTRPNLLLSAAAVLSAMVLAAGAAMQSQPRPERVPDLTLVVLTAQKTPAVGVPVVVINNTPEIVYKSAGALSSKPGEVLVRGRTNDKGEITVQTVKAASYAYEAGDPEDHGYANGQFTVTDDKKPMRVEIVLSPPVKP